MKNLLNSYLTMLYQDISYAKKSKTITQTYGEILAPSIDKLLSLINMSKEDIFFDLGSGLGKAVIQVFLNTLLKEVHGIEIVPELHQIAENRADKIRKQLPELFINGRQLNFSLGSFLTVPFTQASIILLGSPCFSPKMLSTLNQTINHHPHIHTVLTLRPLFNLTHLHFTKAVRIECTWDSALCFIYQR